jgi:serine/threonine protein kinase
MAVSYPRQFGKYVLLKPLAKGGMGEIYVAALGQIDGFDKLCVIKKVSPEKADAGKAKRFLDEAKVVLRLTHSGLVNTFDAGQVEREFYIAMELVEGKDLREVWNRCVRVRHRIPLEVALHVAREVARSLSYVHTYGELNLVHRDVAPPNIMLAYNGDVKLTDFGLARSALKEEHTQPGVVFGRAAYLAPEQARGEVADPCTDIYSLAVVLWELLTGHQYLQIAGLDPAAALAVVRHPKPAPPSSRAPWLTPALDAVVMRALSVDRSKRFPNAEEFRLALSEAIAEAAPRTDATRVSELMHAIYRKAIAEEAAERERFLREVLPSFRAQATPRPEKVEPPPKPATESAAAAAAHDTAPMTTAPPTAEERATGRQAKREAALKVLAELAAEDAAAVARK